MGFNLGFKGLTLVVDGSGGQNHIQDTSPLWKYRSTHYTRSWVGRRTRLDIIERNKIFSPCHNSNSRSSSPEPGHSSNYTIPAQYCKLSKSLLTTNCMKQGVPQRFKELPALYEPVLPLKKNNNLGRTMLCCQSLCWCVHSWTNMLVTFLQYTSQTRLCFIQGLQNFNFTFKKCKFPHL